MSDQMSNETRVKNIFLNQLKLFVVFIKMTRNNLNIVM